MDANFTANIRLEIWREIFHGEYIELILDNMKWNAVILKYVSIIYRKDEGIMLLSEYILCSQ